MPCRGTSCMRCRGTAREVPAAVGLKRRDRRLKRRGRVKCISLESETTRSFQSTGASFQPTAASFQSNADQRPQHHDQRPRPPALGGAQRGWAPRSAGRDKSPENSPAATADRRPTAKKVRKLQAYGHTAQLPKGFPRRGICPPVRPGHLTVWPGSQKVWPGRLTVWAADDLRNTMEGGRQ